MGLELMRQETYHSNGPPQPSRQAAQKQRKEKVAPTTVTVQATSYLALLSI